VSFLAFGDCCGCFAFYNPFVLSFGLLRRNAMSLANFKYKLRLIINSEVNVMPRAVRKAAKAAIVVDHRQDKKAAKAAK